MLSAQDMARSVSELDKLSKLEYDLDVLSLLKATKFISEVARVYGRSERPEFESGGLIHKPPDWQTEGGFTIDRFGRLLGLWVKYPFATSSRSGPFKTRLEDPYNLELANNYWAIELPPDMDIEKLYKKLKTIDEHRYAILELTSMDSHGLKDPTGLGERDIYSWLAKNFVRYVCSSSHLVKRMQDAADELKDKGIQLPSISPDRIAALLSPAIAIEIIDAVPFMNESHLTIVVGLLLLTYFFGQEKLCRHFSEISDT